MSNALVLFMFMAIKFPAITNALDRWGRLAGRGDRVVGRKLFMSFVCLNQIAHKKCGTNVEGELLIP